MCGKVDETVRRVVCECPMLAQMEHKRRHGWVGRKIGKYVEKLVLMQLKNSINTSQREWWKMILGRYYGMLQYKLIMQSWESAAAVGNAVVNAVLCGICGGKKKIAVIRFSMSVAFIFTTYIMVDYFWKTNYLTLHSLIN